MFIPPPLAPPPPPRFNGCFGLLCFLGFFFFGGGGGVGGAQSGAGIGAPQNPNGNKWVRVSPPALEVPQLWGHRPQTPPQRAGRATDPPPTHTSLCGELWVLQLYCGTVTVTAVFIPNFLTISVPELDFFLHIAHLSLVLTSLLHLAHLYSTVVLFVPSITLPCTINNCTSIYHQNSFSYCLQNPPIKQYIFSTSTNAQHLVS